MYTVYKHTAPGGKVYIGITGIEPAKRWQSGSGYYPNKHFYRAIKRYGWKNIKHEIIADGLTLEQAAAMEIELIAKYDSTNPDKGYNSSTGGEYGAQGIKHSAETRRKISEKKKGTPAHNKGQTLTEEHRQKLSEAHRNLSDEARQNMSQAAKKRPCNRKGCKQSDEARRKMSEALSGENHPNFGKRLKPETRQKMSEAAKVIAVMCVETGAIYSSITDAARATGADRRKISAVCLGKRQTTGGYHWKYLER